MTISSRQRTFLSWVTDVLIYIVVLNLYVEYAPGTVIDSFTISILTAVLLKGMLDLITAGKYRVWSWTKEQESRKHKIAGLFGVWMILFFSKFLILEGVNLVFGDHVELGGFLDVMLLVLGMMLTRLGVRTAFRRLGSPDGPELLPV